MGGRSSNGGNKVTANARNVEAKATVSETVNIGSEKNIDKATFRKELSGVYIANVGNVERSHTSKSPAVGMAVAPHRDKEGKTFYTTRFIVYGSNRDWVHSDERYNTLNSAKKAVRTDVKEYLEDLRKKKS